MSKKANVEVIISIINRLLFLIFELLKAYFIVCVSMINYLRNRPHNVDTMVIALLLFSSLLLLLMITDE